MAEYFEVVVNAEDLREYDAAEQAKRERYARVALRSAPVRFDWVSPELNPDGSLAEGEQDIARSKAKKDPSKQGWSGTQAGNSGTGKTTKGWS